MSRGQNNRFVVRNPNGGWDVVGPGADRASSHHNTQAEAIDRAREIVSNAGGGEVRIQNTEGQWRETFTVPPGNDPYPPKG